MSDNKNSTMKFRDKTVDLQETKDLYGRLMVLTRFKGIVHQKHTIEKYEFTLTSKALSTPNGYLLSCAKNGQICTENGF